MSKGGVCLVGLLAVLIASAGHAAPPPSFVEEDVLAAARDWAGGTVNGPSDVAMALDASGRPHIVFHVPRRAVYHAMRTDLGWQLECVDSAVMASPDTSLEFGTHCRIAFDDLGRAHIAYVQERFRNGSSTSWKQIMYRSQTTEGFGVPWTTRESTHPSVGFLNLGADLSLGVSADGSSAYLVTNAAGSFPPVIYQERSGGVWSTPFLPPFPYTASLQDLVVTPDGTPWVCSNSGQSTGDVMVGRRIGDSWAMELAGDSNISTNPNGRLARHGSSGDDLYMCFEVQAGRVALRTRVNGEWRPLVTGANPGPVIPTFGRLRLASAPGGWAPWILSSRGTGGLSGGALLSASSTLSPEQWSTIDVSGTVAVNGSAWIAVGAPNRVHVVYQVRDNSVGGTDGMRLRYALCDAPAPPPLAVDPEPTGARGSLQIFPNVLSTATSLKLKISAPEASDAILTVHDLAGRELRTRNAGPVGPGGVSLTWDLGTLEPGVYFLRMRCGPAWLTRRFVRLR